MAGSYSTTKLGGRLRDFLFFCISAIFLPINSSPFTVEFRLKLKSRDRWNLTDKLLKSGVCLSGFGAVHSERGGRT